MEEKFSKILFEYCRSRLAKELDEQTAEREAACRVAQFMLLISAMTVSYRYSFLYSYLSKHIFTKRCDLCTRYCSE